MTTMTKALMRIPPPVMTTREVFSGNVAFLGPGAVVGRWLGKKLGKKFVWDGEAGQGGVEQGVDGGDMEQNVKSEEFVRALRRIRRH